MNKNRFDGMQFRILEVLEQAKGVPLAVTEIVDRLHAGEYRDVLKDTLAFRVGPAVRHMREHGKIVLSDARAAGDKQCYALPHRIKFPPLAQEQKPANPVIPSGLGEMLKAVAAPPPPPPAKETRSKRVYAPGIQDAIIKLLHKAEAPMAQREIVAALKHHYEGTEMPEENISQSFSKHLQNLGLSGRVKREKAKGLGQGARYRFYTTRTGTAAKPAPAPAPAPTPAPAPAAAAAPIFRPAKKVEETASLTLVWPVAKVEQVRAAAKQHDISLDEFVKQAVEFALQYAEQG